MKHTELINKTRHAAGSYTAHLSVCGNPVSVTLRKCEILGRWKADEGKIAEERTMGLTLMRAMKKVESNMIGAAVGFLFESMAHLPKPAKKTYMLYLKYSDNGSTSGPIFCSSDEQALAYAHSKAGWAIHGLKVVEVTLQRPHGEPDRLMHEWSKWAGKYVCEMFEAMARLPKPAAARPALMITYTGYSYEVRQCNNTGDPSGDGYYRVAEFATEAEARADVARMTALLDSREAGNQ